ncbi:MAG TPA: glycosyltransferase [Planctomycetes bacterium]|nr:glycosyltransferase [Planctomycetota bacterium]
MRICLVTHGFPPFERTGVENYTAALARELAATGHAVEVFTPRRDEELPDLALRRDERDGYGVTWIATNQPAKSQEEALDLPGVAARFGTYLDRERPEIVHFQHLIKLGTGLVAEARQRGIPTVYTAHDYYPVCHRFTLVRPDMHRCETVGDHELCARCDLALSFLNLKEELGDYQLGVLPGQLRPDDQTALDQLLAGDPEPAGFSREDLEAFVQRRSALDEKRLAAYRLFDLILSPTRFLRDRLLEGGLERERIEILTYGSETEGLASLPPVLPTEGAPLRIGYLGGLSKHKGVHVLLDAFELLSAPCELSIWGDSSDHVYVSSLRQRALDLGAHWKGPFRRSELPSCLGSVDVVVVPSIWVENFPFVIREALAAGRPVVASDVGAIPESIRHEVDGLLFEVGNPAALASAIERLAKDPDLVRRLASQTPSIKSIEAQAVELVERYQRLLPSTAEERGEDFPASLVAPLARYRELASLPQRELFRDVIHRLGAVRGVLEGRETPAGDPLPAIALASGSKAKVLLRDLKQERDWLRDSVEAKDKSVEALLARVEWREEELFQRREEVEWLRQTVEDTKLGVEALTKENEWLKGVVEEKDRELEVLREEIRWLKDSLIAYERDIVWEKETSRVLEGAKEKLDEENKALRVGFQQESARVRAGLRALSHLVEYALDVQERASADGESQSLTDLGEESGSTSLRELADVLQARNEQLFRLLDELSLRRREMKELMELARRPLTRALLAPTRLGRRISRWPISTEGPDSRGREGEPR